MNVARDPLKRSLALSLFATLVVVVALVTLGAGLVQREAGEGADPGDAFTAVPEGVPALAGVVTWAEDGPLQERVVEPVTRRSVEAAWTRAWEALQRAANGDDSLVEAWFAGPARAQVMTVVGAADEPVELRLGAHTLRVDFYSDDGSILGVHAGPVETERAVDGRVLRTRETIDVVFVLEDGNWRIRQWLRADVEVLPES